MAKWQNRLNERKKIRFQLKSKVKRGKKSAHFQNPISAVQKWYQVKVGGSHACLWADMSVLKGGGSSPSSYCAEQVLAPTYNHSSWWAVWRNVRHCALCLHSLTNDLLFASILCLCCSSTMLLFNVIFFAAVLTQLLKSLAIILCTETWYNFWRLSFNLLISVCSELCFHLFYDFGLVVGILISIVRDERCAGM